MSQQLKHYFHQLTVFVMLLFMVFVVLFSSCAVRKSVQAHFDLPITKISNVSKTTVGSGGLCQTLVNKIAERKLKPVQHVCFGLLLLEGNSVPSLSVLNSRQPANYPSAANGRKSIPLYILYNDLKVFG